LGFIGLYSAIALMILMTLKLLFFNIFNLGVFLDNLTYIFILGITIIVLAVP